MFLSIWALRGEASLSLNIKVRVTTIAFTHSLSGHPEDPFHPPPAPSGPSPQCCRCRRRRRGPARRERDRKRAAGHQAAQAGAPPASQPPACISNMDRDNNHIILAWTKLLPPSALTPSASLCGSHQRPTTFVIVRPQKIAPLFFSTWQFGRCSGRKLLRRLHE